MVRNRKYWAKFVHDSEKIIYLAKIRNKIEEEVKKNAWKKYLIIKTQESNEICKMEILIL